MTVGPNVTLATGDQLSAPSSPHSSVGSVGPGSDAELAVSDAKILIVDDEPVNFKVVRKYLKTAGYENFVTTSESTEAVALIQREKPDLILLDIEMPEVTGLEILQSVRATKATAQIPILILTASEDQETKQRALNFGATDFLAKPVHCSDLVPRVRNALLVKAYHDHLQSYAHSLQKEVEERTHELALTRLEVIHCLARAAEFRDNETGRHILRVGRYVGIIAREMGFKPATVALMQDASLLHDVGKIGISDSILLKPGKLTPEEFEIMQSHTKFGKKIFEQIVGAEWEAVRMHTDIGAQILSGQRSTLMSMAARIALSHHEKWDGSGYPLALAGEDIPIEGRITAVADVFDALSSKRPYKPAFPLEKCLSILEEERGRHFDPAVLDAFFARRSEIVNVQIYYADVD